MSLDLKKIKTENQNINTMNIDELDTIDCLKVINEEDKKVAFAVEKALPEIKEVVDKAYERCLNGGRVIYVGAGTSGRIGLIDAVECPPTFGVDDDAVMCMLAGGEYAFVKAKEGAEDSSFLGEEDLKNINLTKSDVVIGIAASGRTPYVLGAIEFAKKIGAYTASITTSPSSILSSIVDQKIEAITGEEVITGSTRMKSGTAQKMICNMISTTLMIKLGHVYGNLMIDVKATNEKLVSRMEGILANITGVNKEDAKEYINKYGSLKNACFALLTNTFDVDEVKFWMDKAKGNLKKAIKEKNND